MKVGDKTQKLRRWNFLTQAITTSLAAVLSLWLADLCQLPQPYWAAISAIIVMQSDLGALEATSVNRLIGTAIGALVGAIAVSLVGFQLWSFALAIAAAILLSAVIGRWETHRFAGVTVSIVMLVAHQGSPWVVGLHRFLEVSFGICVAFAIGLAASKLTQTGKKKVPKKSRGS